MKYNCIDPSLISSNSNNNSIVISFVNHIKSNYGIDPTLMSSYIDVGLIIWNPIMESNCPDQQFN